MFFTFKMVASLRRLLQPLVLFGQRRRKHFITTPIFYVNGGEYLLFHIKMRYLISISTIFRTTSRSLVHCDFGGHKFSMESLEKRTWSICNWLRNRRRWHFCGRDGRTWIKSAESGREIQDDSDWTLWFLQWAFSTIVPKIRHQLYALCENKSKGAWESSQGFLGTALLFESSVKSLLVLESTQVQGLHL